MDGAAVATGTAGEATGVGNTGEQGTEVSTTGQVPATEVNGENTETNLGEGAEKSGDSNFTEFNMLEEGEQGEEQENSEDQEGDSLELNLFEGEEFSEEEQAEISEYATMAKELGMDNTQFNLMVRSIQLRMNKQALAKIDAEIASEKNSLQTLKSELSLEERTAWQPLAKQLAAQYGEETAKAIMLNSRVYRAFLGRNKGEGISIKKNEAPKMSYEQALDARTTELQQNLGNDAKVQEILNKYIKDYPEYFEKK